MSSLKLPCVFLIAGAPGSGKSYLTKHLIYQYCKNRKFNHGLVITNTSFNDGYSFVPAKYVHSYYDEAVLQKFLDTQIESKEPAFLVLDDCLGKAQFNSKFFMSFITTYRHYNITVFLTTQYIYAIPPVIRECCTYSYMFQQTTLRSNNALFETFGQCFENMKEFKAFLASHITEEYGTVVCITQQGDKKKKYMKFKAGKTPEFQLDY